MCAGAHARGGDFNPRSPHGERPRRWKLFFLHLLISIHAPRTGSDVKADDFAALIVRISIHAPRTGSDLTAQSPGEGHKKFQSTLPARGATRSKNANWLASAFQSTLPARGATESAAQKVCLPNDFNPRSPHGERQAPGLWHKWMLSFQSTLPARGATKRTARFSQASYHFNPRSPHGERPSTTASVMRIHGDFNPRSPHGERRLFLLLKKVCKKPFQSTLPARGATRDDAQIIAWCAEFQSTLPARGATARY